MSAEVNPETNWRPYVKAPCDDCPFRTDGAGVSLRVTRAQEIAGALTQGYGFSCHKTVLYGECDESGNEQCDLAQSKHCAGAIIMLEAEGKPNQLMQVAERLGYYQPGVSVPVRPGMALSVEEFIKHHGKCRGNQEAER